MSEHVGAPPPPTRVLLIGMMGAGKTTIGHVLAAMTGWDYLDNDELLFRATGELTPDLLRDRGERALRDAESAALAMAFELDPPLIAGVAGGVVEAPADMARLRDGSAYVVWLRARIETLAARVGCGEGRPWLQPDPETALRRLHAGREQRYAAAASLIVDVEERRPDEIADEILAGLSAAG